MRHPKFNSYISRTWKVEICCREKTRSLGASSTSPPLSGETTPSPFLEYRENCRKGGGGKERHRSYCPWNPAYCSGPTGLITVPCEMFNGPYIYGLKFFKIVCWHIHPKLLAKWSIPTWLSFDFASCSQKTMHRNFCPDDDNSWVCYYLWFTGTSTNHYLRFLLTHFDVHICSESTPFVNQT